MNTLPNDLVRAIDNFQLSRAIMVIDILYDDNKHKIYTYTFSTYDNLVTVTSKDENVFYVDEDVVADYIIDKYSDEEDSIEKCTITFKTNKTNKTTKNVIFIQRCVSDDNDEEETKNYINRYKKAFFY